jgi:hypothetical protein
MQPLENTLLLQSAGRNAKHLPSLRSSEASRRTHTTALTGFTALIEVVSLDPVGQFRANWRDANNRARSYRLTWMRPATRFSRGGIPVSATFKIGDHVRWNSEAGPSPAKSSWCTRRTRTLRVTRTTLARMIRNMRSRATKPTTSRYTRVPRCTRSSDRCYRPLL